MSSSELESWDRLFQGLDKRQSDELKRKLHSTIPNNLEEWKDAWRLRREITVEQPSASAYGTQVDTEAETLAAEALQKYGYIGAVSNLMGKNYLMEQQSLRH